MSISYQSYVKTMSKTYNDYVKTVSRLCQNHIMTMSISLCSYVKTICQNHIYIFRGSGVETPLCRGSGVETPLCRGSGVETPIEMLYTEYGVITLLSDKNLTTMDQVTRHFSETLNAKLKASLEPPLGTVQRVLSIIDVLEHLIDNEHIWNTEYFRVKGFIGGLHRKLKEFIEFDYTKIEGLDKLKVRYMRNMCDNILTTEDDIIG